MPITENTFDNEKLSTLDLSFTGTLDANGTTQEQLSSLGAMIENARAVVNAGQIANATAINAFIDKLEAEFIALQNANEEFKNSINTTVGGDITALSTKVTALNTLLNDNDPANAFISVVDYMKMQTTAVNAIINNRIFKVYPLITNGVITNPELKAGSSAGRISANDGYELIAVTSKSAYYNAYFANKTNLAISDLRYPVAKEITDMSLFENTIITVRKIGTPTLVSEFTTTVPTA